MGDRRIRRKPLGTGRGMGRWLMPEGGASDVQEMKAGIERKGHLDRRTPGDNMDLVTGCGRKRGGNRKRDDSNRLA